MKNNSDTEISNNLTSLPREEESFKTELNNIDDSQSSIESETQESEQDIRAKMRTRFLWSCAGLNGKKVSVSMFENITVKGLCRGFDKDIQHMHLQDMETPFAKYSYGTIRLPDCISLDFKTD
ncbi:UNVERIFIED_CONTAM: hypothetical protein RMT77_003988 [Armadillidium vulgare]